MKKQILTVALGFVTIVSFGKKNELKAAEKAIKKQGFTSTKITAQEWQSWQKTLPELVFLLYLCHRELEEYDEATMLIENWIVRSPEDIDAGQLLDEIEKLKGL